MSLQIDPASLRIQVCTNRKERRKHLNVEKHLPSLTVPSQKAIHAKKVESRIKFGDLVKGAVVFGICYSAKTLGDVPSLPLVEMAPCALTPHPYLCSMTTLTSSIYAETIVASPPFAFASNPGGLSNCNTEQISSNDFVYVCAESQTSTTTLGHMRFNGTTFSMLGSPVNVTGVEHPQVLHFQNGTYALVGFKGNNVTLTERDANDQVIGQATWPWINTTSNYPYNAKIAPDSYPCIAKLSETRIISVHSVVDITGEQGIVALYYQKGSSSGTFSSWRRISDIESRICTKPTVIPFENGGYVIAWVDEYGGFKIQVKCYDASDAEINFYELYPATCPRGCGLPGDSYVFVWYDFTNIYLMKLSSTTHAPIVFPTRVNTSPVNANLTGQIQFLDVAVVDNYIVASWSGGTNVSSSPTRLYQQRFAFNGTRIGGEEIVSSNATIFWPSLTNFQGIQFGWIQSWIEGTTTAFARLYQIFQTTSAPTPAPTPASTPAPTPTSTQIPTPGPTPPVTSAVPSLSPFPTPSSAPSTKEAPSVEPTDETNEDEESSTSILGPVLGGVFVFVAACLSGIGVAVRKIFSSKSKSTVETPKKALTPPSTKPNDLQYVGFNDVRPPLEPSSTKPKDQQYVNFGDLSPPSPSEERNSKLDVPMQPMGVEKEVERPKSQYANASDVKKDEKSAYANRPASEYANSPVPEGNNRVQYANRPVEEATGIGPVSQYANSPVGRPPQSQYANSPVETGKNETV